MTIGYDSFTIKQEHVQETPWRDMVVASILTAASMVDAECCVCGEPLGPIIEDRNHHAGLNDEEIGDEVKHYCRKHCPACNAPED